VIDLLDVVKLEVRRRGFKRGGLPGTRVVMETHFYGVLDDVEVMAPVSGLLEVHEAYVSMAGAGAASPEQREIFVRAGKALTDTHGCESTVLVPSARSGHRLTQIKPVVAALHLVVHRRE
jgi:aspartate racemase